MTKDIEPKLKLISDYLKISNDELFIIPEYQRSYSWTVLECDKLWQDIEAFMDSDKKEPYFFGTIIADCSITNKISLIDGQQRTTTFILLLKALLLRIQEILSKISNLVDEDSETLKDGLKERRNLILDILYKTDADNRREVLKDWNKVKGKIIIESLSINELSEYKPELQIIVEAKDFETAENNCYKIKRKQKDNRYTNFFRNFKFFYEKLSNCEDFIVNAFAKSFLRECQIIEIRSWNTEQAITMFNSLNSTGMPLSDADIISAQLYSNAGDDKSSFVETWENITKIASELNGRKIISIDSVLQQNMYITRAQEKVYIKDGSQPDVTTPGLRRYYTSDRKDLLKKPFELSEKFDKIIRIWDKIKEYPIIKLLLKFNENIKLYLVSYLNRYEIKEISEEIVQDIAEPLLRLFAILELVDAGYSSSNFKTFLFGENIKLVDSSIPKDVIKNDFDMHISQKWKYADLENSLKSYEKNILVFLNEYLYAKEHGLSFNFSENVNIEHIMPASGHNIETIRIDAGIENVEEFKAIVNQLGNKILLEEDINKHISNDWFKTKKQQTIDNKLGYKNSKYNIACSLINYSSDLWTKDDIEKATNKATCRILKFIFGLK